MPSYIFSHCLPGCQLVFSLPPSPGTSFVSRLVWVYYFYTSNSEFKYQPVIMCAGAVIIFCLPFGKSMTARSPDSWPQRPRPSQHQSLPFQRTNTPQADQQMSVCCQRMLCARSRNALLYPHVWGERLYLYECACVGGRGYVGKTIRGKTDIDR